MTYDTHTARAQLEHATEDAIAFLDMIDPDPDLEDCGDTEPNGDERDEDGDRFDGFGSGGEDEPIFPDAPTRIVEAETREFDRVAAWIGSRCQALIDAERRAVRP